MAPQQPQHAPQAAQGQQAMQAQAAHGQGGYEEEEEYEEYAGGNRFVFTAVPGWLVSLLFHAALLLILGFLTIPNEIKQVVQTLTVGTEIEEEEELEDFEQVEMEQITDVETENVETDTPVAMEVEETVEVTTDVPLADDVDSVAAPVELTTEFSDRTAPKSDMLTAIGGITGSGLSGRGQAMRGKMVRKYGGSKGSEEAVALALAWLAEHQMPDGGWSFDHRMCPRCQGRCSHEGSAADARNGATGLALLPFLGAGQTHVEGKYQKTVKAGLYFLTSRMKANGSLHEPGGTMYSHGICSIVLCEAYGMTHDRGLMAPAQASINFIAYAQDPVGGGWRYSPKQAGDTSAVGWQLMALKSAHMAYLQVPPGVVEKAKKFLDSVQSDSGAKYGYTAPGAGSATTAVGLLSRMYLGWKQDEPALERGVQFLGGKGPSIGGGSANMYYNYYATQVMRQYEGDEWKKWNTAMRDPLVTAQDKNGHTRGSWHFKGDHGAERGGRLYSTAMATMVLEVYYRHMPIYSKQASEEDFPL